MSGTIDFVKDALALIADLTRERADLRAQVAFKDDAMLTAMRNLVANDATIVCLTSERDRALARNERQRATLAKIRAIVDEPHAALVVDRVRAAIKAGLS